MQVNRDETSGVMPEDVIFALDIGTRTIIGVVGVQKDECFLVHTVEINAHESRAMLDGQIHDISRVVQGVKKVKEALEARLGYKLTKVAIAAAGRVLKTCQVKVEKDIEEGRQIDHQFISALEMEGIQKAQLKIEKDLEKNDINQFYCIGYSVISYFLNDYVISSLLGHKGSKAGVEVLATFLPQTVVDSLYTVMERTGLEVTHLTLEPIAALNLAIPKDLRLLNLALVDIGAGTSDIAITKGGTVVAYAMVPIAGDELTEALAQHYLVDFNTAENIKITLSNKGEAITFTDILDNEISVRSEEVRSVIQPVVDQLARTISEKVMEYNGGKAPNAVFLVGGGSQSAGLCESISTILSLPKERVAVRNRSIAKNVMLEDGVLTGPDSITPLGILVTTAITNGKDFFSVTVNGNKIRMYNSRRMNVSDALILAGFDPEQLICKSGRSLKFFLNKKEKTVRGSFGRPAEIYVNNEVSSLNTWISPGDEMKVIPAEKGADGKCLVSDLLGDKEPIYLTYNDCSVTVFPRVLINDTEAGYDAIINNSDRVELHDEYTIEELAERYEMDPLVWDFKVNGETCNLKTVLKPGDQIAGTPKQYIDSLKTEQACSRESENKTEELNMISLLRDVEQKLAKRDGITVIVNEKTVNLPPKSTDYMFVDIFNHIDFDLTTPKGVIMLRLNSKEANFTDIIKTGDKIDIYWRE